MHLECAGAEWSFFFNPLQGSAENTGWHWLRSLNLKSSEVSWVTHLSCTETPHHGCWLPGSLRAHLWRSSPLGSRELRISSGDQTGPLRGQAAAHFCSLFKVIQTSYQIPPCHLPQVSSPVSAQQENPTGQTYLPPNQKLPWGCYVSSVQTHTLRNSTELW